MSENWELEGDLCRCCHAEGVFINMSKPRELNGIMEIYSNMLKACFKVVIDSVPGPLHNVTYKICESCVLRLRDAYDFMKQVQNCENKFKDYYNRNAIKVKVSKSDSVVFVKEDEQDSLSDSNDCVVPIKGEEEVEEEFLIDYKNCSLDDENILDLENEDLIKPVTKQKEKRKVTKKVNNDDKDVSKLINKLKKVNNKKEIKKVQKDSTLDDKDGRSAPKFRLRTQDYKKDGDSYICGHCNKRYKMSSLRAHVKTNHYKIPKYSCQLCNKQFMTLAPFTVHKLEVHNIDDRFNCKACKGTFNTQVQLRKHIKNFHMLGEKYKCEFCDYESFSFEGMYKHKYKHKTVKDYHCRFCRKSFLRKTNLNLHERIHTDDEILSLINFTSIRDENGVIVHNCNVCKKNYATKGAFTKHYRQIHLKLRKDRRSCHLCDEKVSKYTKAFHLESKHGITATTCNVCGKKFAFPYEVITHQRYQHMGEKRFQCEECGKCFGSKLLLKNHLVSHSTTRDFICDICFKAFKTDIALRTHIKIHDQNKPHICNICDKAFKTEIALRLHIRIHLNIRPHVCNICNKAYTEMGSLRCHIRRKHSDGV
ncbi:Zinc finger protein 709 [Papilio machaon]|uniref:Zinc finger protein 709 n=1 Tax=Papilio machaon TaxID=76193 RepID=A0A194RE72_PAPMA|nr:Zinc finger protein 709 [Papilio machaon]